MDRGRNRRVEGSAGNRNDSGLAGGFYYYVTDEQLDAFGSLTLLQRLQWVEEARLFTLMGQTPQTAVWHAQLREGKVIW